jgi:hypothetical protein
MKVISFLCAAIILLWIGNFFLTEKGNLQNNTIIKKVSQVLDVISPEEEIETVHIDKPQNKKAHKQAKEEYERNDLVSSINQIKANELRSDQNTLNAFNDTLKEREDTAGPIEQKTLEQDNISEETLSPKTIDYQPVKPLPGPY